MNKIQGWGSHGDVVPQDTSRGFSALEPMVSGVNTGTHVSIGAASAFSRRKKGAHFMFSVPDKHPLASVSICPVGSVPSTSGEIKSFVE